MDRLKGLRCIAAIEVFKGILVLAVGLGLLSLLHHDVQHVAEEVVRHFHLNPASSSPRVFIEAAHELTDARLLLLSAGAIAYALFRFVEGYGLWNQWQWAKWLGAVSAGLYVPVELYELFEGVTFLKAVLLALNVAIVWYLVTAIRQHRAEWGHRVD